ncbi:hypothetical protein SZMC14600_18999 [Saccharomonospora azurea SZMC 14600]|uniref:hypothetical protein n=1 Tax=Saccharomonospora azurea TaxID=40988 RepID=UPI00023FF3D0|nr:hypothetical protein [Saccharomonospora azurea]EHK83655.1 hypothetical protein SZMC14600_18999 [Saccharomonospora azurea SZMC 14600]
MSHDHKSAPQSITEWACWYGREIGAAAGIAAGVWLLDATTTTAYLLVLLPVLAIGVQEVMRLVPLALRARRVRAAERAEVA